QAAVSLIRDEIALHSQGMRRSILEGRVPLLEAAHAARQRQEAARVTVEKMAATWRGWTPAQRANFGRTVGAAEIWDQAIVPAIGEERGEFARAVAEEGMYGAARRRRPFFRRNRHGE